MAQNEAVSPGVGRAVLEALFNRAPAHLLILDTELRILRVNLPTTFLRDVPPERFLGRRLTDVYDFSAPGEVEAELCGVLESGTPLERLVRVRAAAAAPEYLFSVSSYRLEDPQGTILGVLAALHDITEREKALRVLDLVRDVGRTLDVVAACQALVRAVVPDFADIAVVDVVDAVVRGDDPPLSPLGREVPLRRVAFGHSGGEEQVQAHPVGDVRALPFPTPYAQALADLKPRLVTLGPDTPWLAADPQRAGAIRAAAARTLITTPLTLRGTVLGLLCLYRTGQADLYNKDDVALALELAAHTALSIDNARRYTREHTIASTVQRHLLPPSAAAQTAVETAHLHVQSEVGGGGWFDTFALSGARTALVVGTTTGQGIHAATTMGQLRTVIHSLATLDLEPDELLARLNDTAIRLAQERAALPTGDPMHRQPLTASCVYAVYNPLTQTFTIARAGTRPPVLAHPDGTTEIPDLPAGPPLGSAEGPPFAAATVTVADGSILAFYTEPLVSTSPSGAPGSPDLLQQVLTHPDRPLQDLCDDALYRLRSDTRHGDAILLLARTRPFPAEQVATWDLGHRPEAVATARTHTQRQLSLWGVDEETAYTAEMIVSELVTNAVRYGTPPLQLRLIKDRALTCEVGDSSYSAPRLRHAKTVDEGGRGLFIVAHLALNWGVRYTPGGKTVWAEQSLPPAPAAARFDQRL
ncbi:SpoIIE family protein phosphatase [Streptomyces sp. NPDC048415]|uniref:SpoIIE family protein phosphatase n=1 Tax=Streptomyces sp. NPDC048415 TaxID=3154822 RepID=UPI0034420553